MVAAKKAVARGRYHSRGDEGLLVFRCRQAFRNGVRKGKAARPSDPTGPAGHEASLKEEVASAPLSGDLKRLQRTT